MNASKEELKLSEITSPKIQVQDTNSFNFMMGNDTAKHSVEQLLMSPKIDKLPPISRLQPPQITVVKENKSVSIQTEVDMLAMQRLMLQANG